MLFVQLGLALVGRFLYKVFFGWYLRRQARKEGEQKVEIALLKDTIDAIRKRIEVERATRLLSDAALGDSLRRDSKTPSV